ASAPCSQLPAPSSIRNKHETPPEKFKSAGKRNLQVLNVERFLAVRGNACCWPAFDTKPTRKRWTNEPQLRLFTWKNL
ncbi:hypothetical protein KR032_001991, partial [Drosophila birchii]